MHIDQSFIPEGLFKERASLNHSWQLIAKGDNDMIETRMNIKATVMKAFMKKFYCLQANSCE